MSLKTALHTLERSNRVAKETQDIPTSFEVEKQLNAALQPLIPMIRRMLAENYTESGLSTGNEREDKRGGSRILEAVQAAKVWVVLVAGKPILRFGLAPNMPKRTYAAAGALEYGSVHAPIRTFRQVDLVNRGLGAMKTGSVLGNRSRKTLKKAALSGQEIPGRSRSHLEKERNVAVGKFTRDKGKVSVGHVANRKVSGKGTVDLGGGVTVRKPWHFFRLSPNQVAGISGLLKQAMARFINKGA